MTWRTILVFLALGDANMCMWTALGARLTGTKDLNGQNEESALGCPFPLFVNEMRAVASVWTCDHSLQPCTIKGHRRQKATRL